MSRKSKRKPTKRKTATRKKPSKSGLRQRLGTTDWTARAKKIGVRLLVLCVIIWGLAVAYTAEVHTRSFNWVMTQIYDVTQKSGFQLNHIEVTGRIYTDPEVLRRLTNVDQGDSLFAMDLDGMQVRIEKLPWVNSVRLKRVWPDTLKIDLAERLPLALWQNSGHLSVLDDQGDIIDTQDLETFSNLPIVTGKDAPQYAPDLIELLKAEPSIVAEFDSAMRVGDRRWDLKLKNGMRIKLPEDDIAFALARVAEAEREFLIFRKEILSLDVRFSDKIIVKTSPGAASRISDTLSTAHQNDTFSVSD